ncbi:MAG: hypothetical protein ACLPTQ_10620, partial [Terriglobales bacterium]
MTPNDTPIYTQLVKLICHLFTPIIANKFHKEKPAAGSRVDIAKRDFIESTKMICAPGVHNIEVFDKCTLCSQVAQAK